MNRAKRRNARIGCVFFIVVAVVALTASIAFGWLGQEGREMRGPIPFAWRHRLYPCGFVRGLPYIATYVDRVPCQVWNLAPLNLVALFAARWLIVDLARLNRPGRP